MEYQRQGTDQKFRVLSWFGIPHSRSWRTRIQSATQGKSAQLTTYTANLQGRLLTFSTGNFQLLWLTFPFHNAALCLTKLSILLQYLRIFPTHIFRIVCYAVTGVVITFGIWTVVGSFLNCTPVAHFWDASVHGACLDFKAVWLFNAAMHIFTDVIIMVLPMYPLSRLHLPQAQKVGLMLIFSLGGL